MSHSTRWLIFVLPAVLSVALLFPAAVRAEARIPKPVEGFEAPKPGEHPRIIFRRSELPEIRRRAATEEGQIVLKRMREMLDQRYTNWNAAAYAFLYLVTEEQGYADKARDAAREVIGRRANPDGRYTWPGNGQLRAGPLMAGLALAYDMAYDGWDEAFRKEIAKAILDNPHTEAIARRPQLEPGANHWGAHSGGLGVALLALRGDPEVDQEKVEDLFRRVLNNIMREIDEGFSERGYYWEGHHCGRFSGNKGIIPFIQAYRNAAGQDLAPQGSNTHWMSTKWIYELIRFTPADREARNIQRGMYARDPFSRSQELSRLGDFALGFGIVPDQYKAQMLWVFNNIVRTSETDYDINEYPHFGAWVIANWPFGVEPRNPGQTMPRILRDTEAGYFVFRNGWTGTADDIIVTALLGSMPHRGRGMGKGGSVEVLGINLRYAFPGIFYTSKETYFHGARDGSGIISARMLDDEALQRRHVGRHWEALERGTVSMAVDFSGASGVPLLVVQVGPWTGYEVQYWMQIRRTQIREQQVRGTRIRTRTQAVEADGILYYVMTLQDGDPPEIKTEGRGLIIGDQTVRFDGEKLILGTMAEPLDKTPRD
ncbi:MAG: hypothetical protein JJU36_09925 [Phycisphaeraceae bacterium]|nr:hypothetical protein [Phycisphaeraceae bacterium]